MQKHRKIRNVPFPRPCGATGNDAQKLHAPAFAHFRGAVLRHEVFCPFSAEHTANQAAGFTMKSAAFFVPIKIFEIFSLRGLKTDRLYAVPRYDNAHALTAADSVIIPVQAQYLPAKGMTQLLSTIAKVKKHTNRNLTIDGILLTLVDGRTNLAKSTVR